MSVPVPAFSIVIPVYNVAPYLWECLDSVSAAVQELECRVRVGERTGHPLVEVICVDDGSMDGSGAILDEYARRQSNNQTIPSQTIFKVIHQPNAGASAARNRGLEIATGEWVWFVDADDEIAEDSLKLLKGFIDDPRYDPLQWVSFRHDIIGESQAKPPKCDGVLYGKTVDCQIAKTFFGAAWSRIFRRSTIGSLRFRAYHYNEDAVFVMDFSSRGRGWLGVDAPLYHYRLSGGSATRRRLSKEVVAKIFESENDLIDSAFRVGEKFPEADLSGLLQVLATRNFLTYEKAYFKLNAAERNELLPAWLSLQGRFSGRCRFSVRRRICLWLARHFRSGRVVKFLVMDLGRVNGIFRRLCRGSET